MINAYLFIYLSITLSQCNQKMVYLPLKVQFDYSNLILRNNEILNFVKEQFNNIQIYINDLFYSQRSQKLYKAISKLSTLYITCDNTKYLYDRENITKYTKLIILPKITINSNIYSNNKFKNPIFYQCLKDDMISLVTIIYFAFVSEKEMFKKIKENFNNLNYHWLIIRNIISSLGFNQHNLLQKKISNNLIDINQDNLNK